jgi:hypothetical protein
MEKIKFKKGDRVTWKSGRVWKRGTVLAIGATKEKAHADLPKGYAIGYQSTKERKGPFYLIASDTPLFQPGYEIHSVTKNHLQFEKESWNFKEEILRDLSKEDLFLIVEKLAKYAHEKRSKTHPEIKKILHQINKDTFFPKL